MSPKLKPLAAVRRYAAVHSRQAEGLSAAFLECLFASAEVLYEGDLSEKVRVDGRSFGSLLVAFDLSGLDRDFRGLQCESEQERIFELLSTSVRLRLWAHRVACREVYRRFPEHELGCVQFNSSFRREGSKILLDIDVEVEMHLWSEAGLR